MSAQDSSRKSGEADFATTRVISKSFELEGIEFSWWAVDEDPAFVTVSSKWFGSKSGFARRDPEATARELAAGIIRQYQSRADQIREDLKARAARRKVD